MSLVLVGTIAQSDPERATRSSARAPPTAKVYAVGKTITGGTKLHSVYPDRVILDRGGKLEALLLPKQFQGGGAWRSAAAAPGARPDSHARRPDPRSSRTQQPGGDHRHHPATAGVRGRPAARLPGLPRAQPPAVQQARSDARRPGHRDQWHAARRSRAGDGDPAVDEQRDRRHGDGRAQWPDFADQHQQRPGRRGSGGSSGPVRTPCRSTEVDRTWPGRSGPTE